MGCAVCGHAPYAHGCPGQAADHEYAQPSGELMAERLDARRRLGLGRTLPTFEPAHEVSARSTPVPASRHTDPEAAPSRTRPAGRTDTRRPAMSGGVRPYRPVETRADRALRLTLARDPLTRRRARTVAHALHPVGRPPLTLLPVPSEHRHRVLRPGLAVAPGRSHLRDTSPPGRYEPYRQEIAA
ncbi:hypothetical protein ACLQ2R_28960 [Streptosporangium sp. DT93]|uniref:hypothetical protein n=1 Tax=Streptosporangium sp. DT93 TaxID=3393428 RepID=UPI003CF4ED24